MAGWSQQQPGTPVGASPTPKGNAQYKVELPDDARTDEQFGGCRSVDHYNRQNQIGEGTYGEVFLAVERHTGEKVALKKIRMENEKEGFPITAVREIKLLKLLDHPNVIRLKEIVRSQGWPPEQGSLALFAVPSAPTAVASSAFVSGPGCSQSHALNLLACEHLKSSWSARCLLCSLSYQQLQGLHIHGV